MNRHLVFRCGICRATTSLQAQWDDARAAQVVCGGCHALYELEAGRDRAESDQAYLEQVRSYAVENRIDLASAYSVIEGILPRDKVRTLPEGSPEIPRAGSSAARSLALLAMLILSLGVLARQMGVASQASPSIAAPGDGAGEARVTGGERPKIAPASYQVNAEGRLTMVTAADPRAALLAFCQHASNAALLQPVAIAPGASSASGAPGRPAAAELRTGIIREVGKAGSYGWIQIRLDAHTRRWTIGDGAGPVELDRGRDLPADGELLTF